MNLIGCWRCRCDRTQVTWSTSRRWTAKGRVRRRRRWRWRRWKTSRRRRRWTWPASRWTRRAFRSRGSPRGCASATASSAATASPTGASATSTSATAPVPVMPPLRRPHPNWRCSYPTCRNIPTTVSRCDRNPADVNFYAHFMHILCKFYSNLNGILVNLDFWYIFN